MAVKDLSNAIAVRILFLFFFSTDVELKLSIGQEKERERRPMGVYRSTVHPSYQSGRIPPLRNKSRRPGHLCRGGGIRVVFLGGRTGALRRRLTAGAAAAADLPVTNDSPREIIKKTKRKKKSEQNEIKLRRRGTRQRARARAPRVAVLGARYGVLFSLRYTHVADNLAGRVYSAMNKVFCYFCDSIPFKINFKNLSSDSE